MYKFLRNCLTSTWQLVNLGITMCIFYGLSRKLRNSRDCDAIQIKLVFLCDAVA